VVDEPLWKQQADNHRKNDENCRHGIRKCCAQKLQFYTWAGRNVVQANCHSEKVDAGKETTAANRWPQRAYAGVARLA
jgi:hypothetical protein